MNSIESNDRPELGIYTTQLHTERLVLRFPKPEEEEVVIDLTFDAAFTVDENGRGFTEGMTWNPPVDKNETRAFMQKNKEAWNEGFYNFAIFLPDATPIGRCVIRPTEESYTYEIGYWMHPNFKGNGYMKEATSALVQFGFTELQAKYITASAARWNIASQKVLLSAGLVQKIPEDTDGTLKNGEFVPQFKYNLERSAWLLNQ